MAHQAQWAAAQGERKINPKDAERERKRYRVPVTLILHFFSHLDLSRQEEELRVTAEQLTIVRRARLVDLYTSEREMSVCAVVFLLSTLRSLLRNHTRRWQQQLAAKGLTIEPRLH